MAILDGMPHEVLHEVVSHIRPYEPGDLPKPDDRSFIYQRRPRWEIRDLLNLSLVSKRMRNSTERVLYRDIELYDNDVGGLRCLLENILKRPELALWILRLRFSQTYAFKPAHHDNTHAEFVTLCLDAAREVDETVVMPEWADWLRAGSFDAQMTLLLARATNLQELDLGYPITRFRFCRNLASAAAENQVSPGAVKAPRLLQNLQEFRIEDDLDSTTEWLPFLQLPSVRRFHGTGIRLSDVPRLNERALLVELRLWRSAVSGDALGSVLRSCPALRRLSLVKIFEASTTDASQVGPSKSHVSVDHLNAALEHVRDSLQYLELRRVTDGRSSCVSLKSFPRLRELIIEVNLLLGHPFGLATAAELGHLLPATVGAVELHASGPTVPALTLFERHFASLEAACSAGLYPNLKSFGLVLSDCWVIIGDVAPSDQGGADFGSMLRASEELSMRFSNSPTFRELGIAFTVQDYSREDANRDHGSQDYGSQDDDSEDDDSQDDDSQQGE